MSDRLRPKVQPNATLEGFYVQLGRTPREVSVPSVPSVLRAQATPSPCPNTPGQPNQRHRQGSYC